MAGLSVEEVPEADPTWRCDFGFKPELGGRGGFVGLCWFPRKFLLLRFIDLFFDGLELE